MLAAEAAAVAGGIVRGGAAAANATAPMTAASARRAGQMMWKNWMPMSRSINVRPARPPATTATN